VSSFLARYKNEKLTEWSDKSFYCDCGCPLNRTLTDEARTICNLPKYLNSTKFDRNATDPDCGSRHFSNACLYGLSTFENHGQYWALANDTLTFSNTPLYDFLGIPDDTNVLQKMLICRPDDRYVWGCSY